MNPAADLLKMKFPDDVVEVVEFKDETTVIVKPGNIVAILTALRDDPEVSFRYLSVVAGIDYGAAASPRFAVFYNLYSHKNHNRLNVKSFLDNDVAPVIDSVVKVFATANWHERETFDLYGIKFAGHPDQRRLLMPADWKGFPLRKDYPLRGFPEQIDYPFLKKD